MKIRATMFDITYTRNRMRGGTSKHGLMLVFRAVSMYRREGDMILPGGMHACRLMRLV